MSVRIGRGPSFSHSLSIPLALNRSHLLSPRQPSSSPMRPGPVNMPTEDFDDNFRSWVLRTRQTLDGLGTFVLKMQEFQANARRHNLPSTLNSTAITASASSTRKSTTASTPLFSPSLQSPSLTPHYLTSRHLTRLTSRSFGSPSLTSRSLTSRSLTSRSLTSRSLTSRSLISRNLTSPCLTRNLTSPSRNLNSPSLNSSILKSRSLNSSSLADKLKALQDEFKKEKEANRIEREANRIEREANRIEREANRIEREANWMERQRSALVAWPLTREHVLHTAMFAFKLYAELPLKAQQAFLKQKRALIELVPQGVDRTLKPGSLPKHWTRFQEGANGQEAGGRTRYLFEGTYLGTGLTSRDMERLVVEISEMGISSVDERNRIAHQRLTSDIVYDCTVQARIIDEGRRNFKTGNKIASSPVIRQKEKELHIISSLMKLLYAGLNYWDSEMERYASMECGNSFD